VRLAQVVGVPDARLLEVPVAFVERVPGAEVTADELIAFCRGQLSGFKVPRAIHFVTEWPMSSTKVQKFRLRETLLGG
jgi:acyl-CoA synthetase (AMP-forming)/AMP-acid ligase II